MHPPAAFLRNYILRRGFRDGTRRLPRLDPQLVLRLPEDPEALGTAARLPAVPTTARPAPATSGDGRSSRACRTSRIADWPRRTRTARRRRSHALPSRCSRSTSTRRGPGAAARTRCWSPCSACARSAIARCSSRIRAASCGSARRKGSTSSRWRRRPRWISRAAWRLSRLLKQLKPDIVHAHDPHGVAMAALALSMSTQLAKPPLVASRRVDFHLRSGALSRWKYRQVDCFICASEAIRQMLVADGVPAARTVTVHEGIDLERVDAAPRGEPARGAVSARTRRRSSATSPRSCRTRGSGTSSRRRRSSSERCPTRGSSSPARASCGRRSSGRSRSTTSRSTCSSPASAPTCCRCTRRSTSS